MSIKLGKMINILDALPPPIIKGDNRFKHFYLLGATRSGKSSVFLNAIKREINDGAIVLLDPDGNLAREVATLAPKDRLVYVNKDNPLVINLLSFSDIEKSERALELTEAINNSVRAYNPDQYNVSSSMGMILTEVIYALPEEDLNMNCY